MAVTDLSTLSPDKLTEVAKLLQIGAMSSDIPNSRRREMADWSNDLYAQACRSYRPTSHPDLFDVKD